MARANEISGIINMLCLLTLLFICLSTVWKLKDPRGSTYRQDESPKAFEMATLGSESIKPSRYTGIYRHDGDTRVLCVAPDGKPRPDEFTAPRRSHRTLVTLKRAREP